MKHLLNNLSNEEKNSIREQHDGGMSLDTSKFKKLMESKLGDSKPLVSEQGEVAPPTDLRKTERDFQNKFMKLAPGLDSSDVRRAMALLIGTEVTQGKDLPTRIETYERHRVKSGLTQLPSGDMISLILTLK
jgi:hypothetical protein